MPDTLRDELRRRVGLRSVLIGVGLLVGLRVLFDASVAQLGVTAVTGAISGLTGAAEEAYDLRSGVRWFGLGAIAVVFGAALFAFDDGAAWLPAAFLLVGVWVLFDAVQTLRHDGIRADETERDGSEVYHTYVVRRVHEVLDERPRTRRELSEAVDSNDEAIDRALDTLRERGLLDRNGSELRVSSPEEGVLAMAREKISSGSSRLARPVTLEREER